MRIRIPKHVALQLHGVRLGLLECSAPLFRRKVRLSWSELRESATSVELHYMDPKDCRAAERGITCRQNSMGVVECSAPLFRRKVRLRREGWVCTSVEPHYMPSKIAGLQNLSLWDHMPIRSCDSMGATLL
jgi:hypothetical protein